jgi:hypothetical protein
MVRFRSIALRLAAAALLAAGLAAQIPGPPPSPAALGAIGRPDTARADIRHSAVLVDTLSALIPTIMTYYSLCAEYQLAFLPFAAADASIGLFRTDGEHGPSFQPEWGLGLRWMMAGKGLSGWYLRLGWTSPWTFGYSWAEASFGYEYQAPYGLVIDSRLSAILFIAGYPAWRLDLLRVGWSF